MAIKRHKYTNNKLYKKYTKNTNNNSSEKTETPTTLKTFYDVQMHDTAV